MRASFAILCFGVAACSSADSSFPVRAVVNQVSGGAASQTVGFDAHILVDQFGYRPGDPKVAVIRDPRNGFDSRQHFAPGPEYQVRSATDGTVAFSGKIVPWKSGEIEDSSGDAGWWFDFSTLSVTGSYFIYDVANKVRSATFRIDQAVYKNVLKAATRMYFYQRSGFAKRAPYAEACWIDDAAYLGPNQDTLARDVTDRDNRQKVRDLSGGWFDAGDTNRYVTFAIQPVHQLLTAYQEKPSVFTDDFNIPESGNGIPDLLDEVKWEIEWLEKMQYKDGSAALKVGEINYVPASPPSTDLSPRYYVPSCTSSTIAVAGMFAHASYVFSKISALSSDAAALKGRAIQAWENYLSQSRKQVDCDSGIVHANKADLSAAEQDAEAVVAAVYLFAVSGRKDFDDYIAANYRRLRPYRDIGWSRYSPEQGVALLFYTTLPTANQALKKAILADKLNDVLAGNKIYGFNPEDDLYRDYLHDPQYHWGSNNPRASYGNTNMDVLTYGISVKNAATYQTRALEVLHYFHGVNPFGKVYLTNMYEYGATNSVNEIYHTWFWVGSKWSDALKSACGPAPGYVPGGPVANAQAAGIPAYISPPAGQPEQKAYRDWNGVTPENSWVINEAGIYYQSAYLELLSKFAE